MSRADARRAGPLARIDLHQDRVLRGAFADQRRDGRIACVAAVPVFVAVDLDGLEHGRQAGGSQQHVGGDLGIAKHAAAPGAHIGGGDEQLDRRLRQPLEVDDFDQYASQRVVAAGVEIVGRKQPRHDVNHDEHRRIVQRPSAHHAVEGGALEGLNSAASETCFQKAPARRARLARRLRQAVSEHGSIHRPGRGAGDAVDLQPRFFQQTVEHAPGKGAVRAAALQGEINQNGFATGLGRSGLCVLHGNFF